MTSWSLLTPQIAGWPPVERAAPDAALPAVSRSPTSPVNERCPIHAEPIGGTSNVWKVAQPAGHRRSVPSSDHFPLGRAYGRIDTEPEPASAARPFGLSLAVPASAVHRIDLADLGYDEEAQIGLIRDGATMVPLSKHTDGQTSTVTQGGDGQTTNKDSDTDQRED